MATTPQWRIMRLELQNWRNFGRCEMQLAQRSFIVGPNASGKSNLLDAFSFLRHLVVPDGGGLQAAVAHRGGVSSIRALHARNPPEVRILAEVGQQQANPVWRYEIAFNAAKRKPPEVATERLWKNGFPIIDRPDQADRADPQRLTQTAMEQVNLNRDARDLVEFFRSIRFRHVTPQLMRGSDWAYQKDDPFGRDLIQRIADTPKKNQTRRLEKLLAALQIAVPQIQDIEPWQDNRGHWHIRARYSHWRRGGAWQTEERFSDGTLRLLGLLWELQEPGGPLLLEEPELSLNAAIVKQLPILFHRAQRRGRQVIVTTHSDALLTDAGIGLDEVHVLTPQDEGTRVESAGSIGQVRALLEGGLTMGQAILPRIAPANAEQLSLAGI
jgi:predicted ATPase